MLDLAQYIVGLYSNKAAAKNCCGFIVSYFVKLILHSLVLLKIM